VHASPNAGHSHIYTYIHTHIYIHIYTYIYIHTHIYILLRTWTPLCPMHLCTYAPMHLCTYAPMHLCTYAPMHLCTYALCPMSYALHPMSYTCLPVADNNRVLYAIYVQLSNHAIMPSMGMTPSQGLPLPSVSAPAQLSIKLAGSNEGISLVPLAALLVEIES
jgi:hypothetical protein